MHVMSPGGILRLADHVYLLSHVPKEYSPKKDVDARDMVVFYDKRYWRPGYSTIITSDVQGKEYLSYFILPHFSDEHSLCSNVCRVWLDMRDCGKDWWYQRPLNLGGRDLPAPLPSLETVFPSYHKRKFQQVQESKEEARLENCLV